MNIFQKLRAPRVKRNAFDLSHERKMSFDMGEIIPILIEEVVPSDKFTCNTEIFMRLAPMIGPVMHRVNVFVDYFYVPNRIVWKGWEKFISGGQTGDYAGTAVELPTLGYGVTPVTPTTAGIGTLSDYFGLPQITANYTNPVEVCLLPYLAYQTIWWEYYRHQYLQNETAAPFTNLYSGLKKCRDADGTVTGVTNAEITELIALKYHNYESDYFTSSLPWTQLGTPITFGAGTTVGGDVVMKDGLPIEQTQKVNAVGQVGVDGASRGRIDPNHTWKVENELGENYTTFNVNDLRKAFQVQRWMERNARAGIRYIEQLFAHFGVKSSDARLQRPEYLGGGKAPVVISEVLQTAGTSDGGTTGVGNMAGHGYAAKGDFRFSRYFEEHGYVIGLMTVMPRTSYMQGMQRTFMRKDQLDYYFPEFAHLGEQKVYNAELYLDDTTTQFGAFGYTPRYQEYRQRQSTVHGHFKQTNNNLYNWHLGRRFASRPGLNSTFIQCTPGETERIFQSGTVAADDHLIAQLVNHVTAIRPMPKFGYGGLVDHVGGN